MTRPVTTIALVGLIATAAAILVTASWEFSRDRIAANERARLLASLSSVLDPVLLAKDLDPVQITVSDETLLGTDQPVDVFLPVDGSSPLAAIVASVAPDGYNSPIFLLIGIDMTDSRISGVRVVSHRETPGLGDLIDIEKSNWILQFDDKRIADTPALQWAVTRDEGEFDSITGATVTSRAIIQAVHNTLLYFEANRDELISRARDEAIARDTSEQQ